MHSVSVPEGTLVAMPATTILDDALLLRLRERAARHDAENSFPHDDLAELRERGYLRLYVPQAFGGGGAGLAELVAVQRQLSTAAPATALALGMHQVAVGIARGLAAADPANEAAARLLREVAAGELAALAISEAGNDAVLFDSTVRAEPDGGGYRLTGRKVFTSLSPVWTRLVTFGRDDSSSEAPRLVFGVLHRDDPGITVHGDWNALGQRATGSHSTSFQDARLPSERILAVQAPGPNASTLTFAVFTNFLLLIGAAYLGVSERAIELAAEAAAVRRSRSDGGRRLADDPQVRDIIAAAGLRHLAALVQLEATARDVDEQAAHGASWFPRLTGAKLAASVAARRSVEAALEVVGGAGFHAEHELSRLHRDATASIFHPSQARSVRRTAANWLLGPIQDTPTREGDD